MVLIASNRFPHHSPSNQFVYKTGVLCRAGLEGLLDIPPDADDETMVELAIALSLQEQPRRAPAAPSAPPPPAPGFSDATASPPG